MLRIDEVERAYSILLGDYQRMAMQASSMGSTKQTKDNADTLWAMTTIAAAVVELRKAQEGYRV